MLDELSSKLPSPSRPSDHDACSRDVVAYNETNVQWPRMFRQLPYVRASMLLCNERNLAEIRAGGRKLHFVCLRLVYNVIYKACRTTWLALPFQREKYTVWRVSV